MEEYLDDIFKKFYMIKKYKYVVFVQNELFVDIRKILGAFRARYSMQ